jgi:hypothetical protein
MKLVFVALCCVTVADAGVSLTGAGSTFIAPVMSKWCSEFQKTHPDVQNQLSGSWLRRGNKPSHPRHRGLWSYGRADDESGA